MSFDSGFSLVVSVVTLGSVVACGSSASVDFFDLSVNEAGRSSVPTPQAGAAGAPATAGAGGTALAQAGRDSGPIEVPQGGSAGASSVAAGNGGTESGGEPGLDQGGHGGAAEETPCAPVIEAEGKMTGPINTTGPYCLRVMDDISGWGCSNFAGRTVKVNGVLVKCAELPLPDKIRGAYYFDVSAGGLPYASLYWYP